MVYYKVEVIDVDEEFGKSTRYVTLEAIPRVGETVVIQTSPFISFRVVEVAHYCHSVAPRNAYIDLHVEKLP